MTCLDCGGSGTVLIEATVFDPIEGSGVDTREAPYEDPCVCVVKPSLARWSDD